MVREGERGLSVDERSAAEASRSSTPTILAIADAVSPFIYSTSFPGNLPPLDVILSAGDMPGDVLEFVATKAHVPPVYVLGNHGDAFIRDPHTDEPRLPGGCINAHLRLVEVNGVVILGVEGSARYREGDQQYSEREFGRMLARLTPQLWLSRRRRGRAVDVLLTHAPPLGPNAGQDFPHRGVPAFNAFHRRWRPLLHVHGHVHLSGSNAERSYVTDDGVRVVNAYEFTVVELPGNAGAGDGGR